MENKAVFHPKNMLTLQGLLNSNGHGNGHTDHGVVYLRLDEGFTVETKDQECTFYGYDIEGTVCRSTERDSRAYAIDDYREQRSLHEEAWIDNWGPIWYTVLRSPGLTEVRALIVDGDAAWELRLESTDPSRLPHMIHIATDNFA